MHKLFLLSAIALPCIAQTVCQPTPTYSPCEIVFELSEQEAASNPYLNVEIEAEFRSPRFRTFRMPGFWDGGRRFVIRFSPVDPGDWVFRISSNLPRFEGKQGSFPATDSQSAGFLKAANVHHWARVDDNNRTPHLWMGDTLYTLPFIDRQVFDKLVAARAEQKFTHLRGVVLAPPGKPAGTYVSADQPNPATFRELDERILALNRKGIIADLMLAYDRRQLESLFPSWPQRERYIRYLIARYSALDVTWQGFENFEQTAGGRAALREVGLAFKKLDPYQHVRSTGTDGTSSSLLNDEWMNYVAQKAEADDAGAIEHQLYAVPFVNLGFAQEDSGAGKSRPGDVDTDTFRKRLWNSSMNGQYPTFANTGTRGGSSEVDPKHIDSPGARQMAAWFDFFSRTRHWEMEPYFDVDGGRALALEGVEYVVYVEKPGPVEVVVEKHGYDVAWFNPVTGEFVKQKKGFKGDRFTGEPPDNTHDWVLDISREGRKESMLRSYKFDSRDTPIGLQEIEVNPQKLPFDVAEPAGDTVSVSAPAKYAARITRETRATRSMMYLWMGEVAADGEGSRIIGAGSEGAFRVPDNLAKSYPAVLAVRLYGMNANGKVYTLIKVYKLTK
jgi:hypothetical protein